MKFKTKTGSEYEIVNHPAGDMIRRINPDAEKRADGEWVRLMWHSQIVEGHSAVLQLESLSGYGPDDDGSGGGGDTIRTTSTVVEVWDD